MVSPTLVKLIDEAILPGFLLVLAKIFGVILIAKIISAKFTVSAGLFFFPTFTFTSLESFFQVNSYSNLVMFLVVVAGAATILARAHFFHASHISPAVHLKLLKLGLEGLIAETHQLYHQAVVWLVFLWLSTILILLQTFFGLSAPLIGISAFLVSLNFTWFLIADIEQEITIFRKQRKFLGKI